VVAKRKKKKRLTAKTSVFKAVAEGFKFAKWALEVAALIITIRQCQG
jgi:hypothetical protein